MCDFTGWQPPEREDPANAGGGAELGGRHQPLGPGLPHQWHPLLGPLLPGPRPVPPGQGDPGPQPGREAPTVPAAADGPSDGPSH